MSMDIRLDRRTTAPLLRKIRAMRERSGNLIPAWQELTDWFTDQNRLQWGSRGARYGTPWRELAPPTLADKLRENWPTDILRRTRDLERSLTDRPLSIELLEPHSASMGTRHPVAKFHQRGTRYMHARPLFVTRRIAAEGAVGRAVASWIVRGSAHIGDPG